MEHAPACAETCLGLPQASESVQASRSYLQPCVPHMLVSTYQEDIAYTLFSLVLAQEAPAGSLQLTGVLGLAALVWGLYQLQAPPKRRDQSDSSGSSSARRPATGTSLPQQPKPAQSSSAAQVRNHTRQFLCRHLWCSSPPPPSFRVCTCVGVTYL